VSKLSDATKAAIDSMARDALVQEINLGRASRYQGDSQAYLHTRLAYIVADESAGHQRTQQAAADRANELAVESNAIARSANAQAAKAHRIAVLAVIISLLAILVAVLRA
jgi:hypothetical protein